MTTENSTYKITNYIKVRTQFEGWHYFPNASKLDPRIEFLEHSHRHMFHVTVQMSVNHSDRECEFFLVKWALNDYLNQSNMENKSCEMMATDIIEQHLIPTYGTREYKVTVSEDNESDGIVEYYPVNNT